VKITNHGQYLVKLTRYPTVFPMNCYLVREEDGLTLVDSTMSSPAADVARVAAELGLQLRRVALTHAHGDHVGGVAGVRDGYPGVIVSIGERDARLLAGDTSLQPGEPQVPAKGWFVKVPWEPDQQLKPGDRVGSLEVVASPGHTPGHIAFLDVRDRTMIAGDAFQTRGGIAVSGVVRETCAATSMPVMRGILTSMTATVGRVASILAAASSPFDARPTTSTPASIKMSQTERSTAG